MEAGHHTCSDQRTENAASCKEGAVEGCDRLGDILVIAEQRLAGAESVHEPCERGELNVRETGRPIQARTSGAP